MDSNDISKDPEATLFFTPYTNATPAGARLDAGKPKAPQKKKNTSPLENLKKESRISLYFEPEKDEENIRNKTIPIGTMNSYFYGANLQKIATVNSHSQYLEALREHYKQAGSQGLPKEIREQSEFVELLQKWRLAENALLFADGASGIFKALTCYDNYFVGFEPLVNTTTGDIEKYLVYATIDQLKKCFFGSCVDEYGNLKRGTKEILQKSGILKAFTDAVFGSNDGKSTGREPILYIYDKENKLLGYYKPIIFEGYDYNVKAYKVLLDPRFFKLQVDQQRGTLKADVRYIPTIGGLTALNIIGRACLARDNKNISLPYAKTATRLIHTLQASFNLQSLLGVELFPGMNQAKQKIRLNKSALIELFPKCYNTTTGYINYKKASEQVGLSSDILYKGLEVVGGLPELLGAPESEKIFLPSIDKSCYFDSFYQNAVFVNCETPRQAIGNTGKLSYIELKRQIQAGTLTP